MLKSLLAESLHLTRLDSLVGGSHEVDDDLNGDYYDTLHLKMLFSLP